MKIITLTSDMGIRDYYVAAVKGAIYKQLPDATVVDISHHITPFDISQAAFVIRNAYHEFPEGTVHLIGINPAKLSRTDLFDNREAIAHIVVKKNGHYFIGADNGIFSLLFEEGVDSAFEITLHQEKGITLFPMKTLFVDIAVMILNGATLEEIGLPYPDLKERSGFRPVIEKDLLKGTVIYVDSYGNVITNITKEIFESARKNRKFTIYFRSEDYEITEISNQYHEVPQAEKVAVFSSSGHLELAIYNGVEGVGGGASSLFGLNINDTVRIEFYD